MKFKIDKKEVLSLGFIIAICMWLFDIAGNFPEATKAYPQMILIATITLAVIEIILKTIKLNKTDYQKPFEKKSPAVLIRVLTVAAICVIYVFLVDLLGFFSSTAVFSFALMYYLGVRKPVTLIAVAAGLNIGVYLLFVTFLRISMPQGLLF
jgi:putative tricarboxylic transport membrane protein